MKALAQDIIVDSIINVLLIFRIFDKFVPNRHNNIYENVNNDPAIKINPRIFPIYSSLSVPVRTKYSLLTKVLPPKRTTPVKHEIKAMNVSTTP